MHMNGVAGSILIKCPCIFHMVMMERNAHDLNAGILMVNNARFTVRLVETYKTDYTEKERDEINKISAMYNNGTSFMNVSTVVPSPFRINAVAQTYVRRRRFLTLRRTPIATLSVVGCRRR